MKNFWKKLLISSSSDSRRTVEPERSHNFKTFELGRQNPKLVDSIRRIVEDRVRGDMDKLREVLLFTKDVRVEVEEENGMDGLTLCEFDIACKEGAVTYKIIADPNDHKLTILPYGNNLLVGDKFLRELEKA